MSARILVLGGLLAVAGVAVSAGVFWLLGVPLLFTGLWLMAVERAIGVGHFFRFDPWRPASRRARRVRTVRALILGLAATVAACYVGIVHPQPLLFIACVYGFATLATVWWIGFIRSDEEEQVIEIAVRDVR